MTNQPDRQKAWDEVVRQEAEEGMYKIPDDFNDRRKNKGERRSLLEKIYWSNRRTAPDRRQATQSTPAGSD